jgi:2-desacetyl-2-hydroxyethyl bacteriochlorophyllide A dehydrogenase
MIRTSIIFTGKDEVRVIDNDDALGATGHDDIQVRTTRTLISTGTEGIVLGRKFSPGTHWDGWVKYPFRPGYSHVGVVTAVGDGVTEFRVGDRVVTRAPHTSHAQVKAVHAVRIPDGVSDDDATWTALGKIAQIGVRAAEHRLGDAVAGIGLGLVGQLVVQYVRLMGARDIIAIDPAELRLEMAKSHGATQTLAMPADAAVAEVQRLCAGRGPRVVYDVTGHPAVFPAAMRMCGDFGRVVLLGDTGTPELQHLTPDVIRRGLSIVGAHDRHAPADPTPGVEWDARRTFELFLTFLARGQMRVADLVTHRYKPQQAPDAYRMLDQQRDRAMGVIFEWA